MYQFSKRGTPLFPLALFQSIGAAPGEAARLLWPSARRHASANFARVLDTQPEDPRVTELVRDCFRQFGMYFAEMIHLQGWDTDELLDRVEVHGAENFAAAQAYGRGIIFVSGHMGSTEVAAALAVLRGHQVTAITERIPVQWMQDWIVRTRAAMGITLVSSDGAGVGLIRRLRKGGMIAMLVDAGIERTGSIPVEFFGLPAPFPDGPARLARLTGAPLVFGLAVRRPGGRFDAHICPPLVPQRETPAEIEVPRLTQALATTFEAFVRRDPAQWYAFRPVWPR
jgi:KDO2-lipid IV(A) lauroyltransferase